MHLELVSDATGAAREAFGADGIPHMVTIGRDGRILKVYRPELPLARRCAEAVRGREFIAGLRDRTRADAVEPEAANMLTPMQDRIESTATPIDRRRCAWSRRPSGNARLFLALWPDAAVRSRLAAQRDALRMSPGGRAVTDGNLHATLHFIGAVGRERIRTLWEALSEVEVRPVRITATTLAIWKGGTVVLQLQGDGALTALHTDTGAALRTCGVALDARPFAPHVTLARGASSVELPSAPNQLDWRATGFALVESTGGSPPTYRVLAAR